MLGIAANFTDEITEITNELGFGYLIFTCREKSNYRQLEYEPIPDKDNNGKTIDFKILKENCIKYVDLKTIHPKPQDDWKKFKNIVLRKLFPNHIGIVIDKKWLGGEIWHDLYNSRQAMLDYTIELEEKIKNYNISENTKIGMTFCKNNSFWSLTDLEDFADFYKARCHNPDDIFAKMEKHYVKKNNINLERNIDFFCYLERDVTKTIATKFYWNVHGPYERNRISGADE